jgi:acyl phosphate:glycerol-3-phosphate acyltransferase
MSPDFIIAAESYLLGSIPFGYVLVLLFRGEDVRKSGSGNTGATNVSRTSPALGVLTLLLDGLKGAAAVVVARKIVYPLGAAPDFEQLALAALFAVLGHVFPIWLKFRGGKGVATGLGAFLVIAPKAAFVAIGLFLLIVIVSRFVSLGSVIAVACLPLLVYELEAAQHTPIALALMSITSLLIVIKHHQNIRRLLAGTENRLGAKAT